jgi:hypothetical protein
MTQQDGSRSLRSHKCRLADAFVPGCLSSHFQLPGTLGFPSVVSYIAVDLLTDGGAVGVSHGTGRPRRRYNSSVAGYSSCLVACAQSSSALPDAWQRKQRQTLRPKWAENDRLLGADDP